MLAVKYVYIYILLWMELFKLENESFSRLEKWKLVKFYFDIENNLYQTCKKFSVNCKNILRWIKNEEKIGNVVKEASTWSLNEDLRIQG